MYICNCNPFTDSDVTDYLDKQKTSVRFKETYKACSGGEEMNCGTCANDLKLMLDTHNNDITIQTLSNQMEQATKQEQKTLG